MAVLPSLIAFVFSFGSLAILYGVWRFFCNVWLHKLRDYPGPLLGRASILYSSYYHLTGTYPLHMKNLHATYGNVVRISPNELSYISAQAWQDIYTSPTGNDARPNFEKDESAFTRGRKIYTIINAPHEAHRRMREVMSHAFSEEALTRQEPIILSHVNKFIDQLRTKSQDKATSTFDIMSWFNFTSFDITGDLMYGQSFRCLELGAPDPWINYLFASMRIADFLRVARRLPGMAGTFMMFAIFLIAPKDGPKHLARAHKSAEERLKKGSTGRGDFVDEILAHDDGKGITPDEIKASSTGLILAGSETIATLLTGAIFYLLRNNVAMEKLTKEIRQNFKSDGDVTFKAVSDLKYLNAVLQETLRVYPPVGDTLTRLVPNPGFVVDGRNVPGGTLVGVQQYAANRSPQNFKQADSFAPERWLGDLQFQDDKRGVVQPFSVGARDCLGKRLAWAEMRVILAKLVWEFDLELLPQSAAWSDQKIRMLWEKQPLYVNVSPKK